MSVTSLHANEGTRVSRYLAGQLSDEECEIFESQLTRDPTLLRELEATARLKFGLETLRERGELEPMLAPSASQPWVRWAAAAAVAVIALGVMMFRFTPQRAQGPMLAAAIASLANQRGQVLPVTGTVAIFRKRADAYDAVIDTPAAAGALEVRVLPETTAPTQRYDIALSRLKDSGAAEPLASVTNLQPADDGFVTVYIDAVRLADAVYRIEVRAAGTAGVPDAFRVRVRHGTP